MFLFFQNMKAWRIAVFMLTQFTFWQEMGRPVLKWAAILSCTHRNKTSWPCVTVTWKLRSSQLVVVGGFWMLFWNQHCICVSLSDSQGSALWSRCSSKKTSMQAERGHCGGMFGICQAGLSQAMMFIQLITLISIHLQSHVPEQCSTLPLDVLSPYPDFSLGVSPSEQCFVSLQLTGIIF